MPNKLEGVRRGPLNTTVGSLGWELGARSPLRRSCLFSSLPGFRSELPGQPVPGPSPDHPQGHLIGWALPCPLSDIHVRTAARSPKTLLRSFTPAPVPSRSGFSPKPRASANGGITVTYPGFTEGDTETQTGETTCPGTRRRTVVRETFSVCGDAPCRSPASWGARILHLLQAQWAEKLGGLECWKLGRRALPLSLAGGFTDPAG